jgi:hypothetical protein
MTAELYGEVDSMANISKQDRQGARTPADIERKYNFNQSFAQVSGYAAEARRAAEQASQAADSINDVFTRDIVMTGTFTNTVEAYLIPMDDEIATIQDHCVGTKLIPDERIPLYDFNNDGVVDTRDVFLAIGYQNGNEDFSKWTGAVKSVVTMTIDLSDPAKAIRFTGVNMWGRAVESFYGIDFTTAINRDVKTKLDGLQTGMELLEERVAALETQGGGINGS